MNVVKEFLFALADFFYSVVAFVFSYLCHCYSRIAPSFEIFSTFP